jgi:hypothetical protein
VSEQRTPDELGIENEAICETLLGWKRSSIVGHWFPSQEHAGTVRTPSFTTWADAGLILDALTQKERHFIDVGNTPSTGGQIWQIAIHARGHTVRKEYLSTGPLAIRAAALAYIRSLP